jgi:formylglycine-generating enzyme required for sulfatase activity
VRRQDSEHGTRLGAPALAALVTLLTTGCASVIGLDDLHRIGASSSEGGAGPGSSAGSGAGGWSGGNASPSGASSPCGAQGGGVQVNTSDSAFCIDATEVTNGEYASFLDAGAPGAGWLPDGCRNHDFQPSQGWPAPRDATDQPVTWVDWCDAFAYCAWAGESLCGQAGGGALDPTSDPTTTGEWYFACSGEAGNSFPYGASYVSGVCNDDTGGPLAVGSLSQCVGGYAGLFDMSGNVAEWENSCAGGGPGNGGPGNDSCSVRGGSFQSASTADQLACGAQDLVPRNSTAANIGFRCCSP